MILLSAHSFDEYVSPSVVVYQISCEGVICASGTHDSFTEDDEWINNIK